MQEYFQKLCDPWLLRVQSTSHYTLPTHVGRRTRIAPHLRAVVTTTPFGWGHTETGETRLKEKKRGGKKPQPQSSGAILSGAAQSSLGLGWREGDGERKKRRRGQDEFVVRWELPPISFPCPSQACQSREPRQIRVSRARGQTDRQTAPLTESQPSPAAAARGGDQGENMDKGAVPSAAKVPMWMWRISRGKSEGRGLRESANKGPGREVERGSCEGSRGRLRAQIPRGEADLMASNSLIALFP